MSSVTSIQPGLKPGGLSQKVSKIFSVASSQQKVKKSLKTQKSQEDKIGKYTFANKSSEILDFYVG